MCPKQLLNESSPFEFERQTLEMVKEIVRLRISRQEESFCPHEI